jgi:Cytochrome oxidase complex assembly protein 1
VSTPTNFPSPGTPPHRRSWWSRNWKWFVPTGCLTLILLFAAFIGAVVLLIFGSMKQSDVYKHSLAKAQTDPVVAQKLGTPIKPGMWLSGNININGPSGEAKLSIPISGPKGTGTIYVEATKSAGKWNYSLMQVAIDGEDTRIDLLQDFQEQ